MISVNTGRGRVLSEAPRIGRTAIDKRPAAGPVAIGRLGLAGDEQVDKAHHGGPYQAVYAYAREDLDWWVERLGRELGNGVFGENVTTAGLDVSAALIGETWRLGTAVVQVASVRVPCGTFAGWMGEPRWVKRFAVAGRPVPICGCWPRAWPPPVIPSRCCPGRRPASPSPRPCRPTTGMPR